VHYSYILENASKTIRSQVEKGKLSIDSAYSQVRDKVEKGKGKKERSSSQSVDKSNIQIDINSAEEAVKLLQNDGLDMIAKDLNTVENIKANKKLRIGIIQNEQ